MPNFKFDFSKPDEISSENRQLLARFLEEAKAEGENVLFEDRTYTLRQTDPTKEPTQITLSQTIICRPHIPNTLKNINDPNYRFEVVGKILGSGGMGSVYKSLLTIKPNAEKNDVTFNQKTGKKRLAIKVMFHFPHKQDAAVPLEVAKRLEYQLLSLKLAEKEVDIGRGILHLHMQGPVTPKKEQTLESLKKTSIAGRFLDQLHDVPKNALINPSFITMRYFEGSSLDYLFMGDIFDFSTTQFLLLSKKIAEAVQTQVADLQLIHQDLTPRNVIVNVSNDDITVTIIDYAMAKHLSDNVRPPVPNCKFYAPEVFEFYKRKNMNTSEIDQSSDRFSIGEMLKEVWLYQGLDKDLKNFNKRAKGLSPEQKNVIIKILDQLTNIEKEKRPDLHIVADVFTSILEQKNLENLALENHKEQLQDLTDLAERIKKLKNEYESLSKNNLEMNPSTPKLAGLEIIKFYESGLNDFLEKEFSQKFSELLEAVKVKLLDMMDHLKTDVSSAQTEYSPSVFQKPSKTNHLKTEVNELIKKIEHADKTNNADAVNLLNESMQIMKKYPQIILQKSEKEISTSLTSSTNKK